MFLEGLGVCVCVDYNSTYSKNNDDDNKTCLYHNQHLFSFFLASGLGLP